MNDLILSRHGFFATAAIIAAVETLLSCAGGRFAAIMGYRPVGKDWVTVPKYDATVLTRFSTERLYERKLAALDAITFDMLADAIAADPMLSKMDDAALREVFTLRKAMERDSLTRTRVDTQAHRDGQERCHATLAAGVRVHYLTAKADDGLMYPILRDGLPVADCVRLSVIEQSRRYIVKGVRKIVNSGAPVRMGNAIASLLNKRSVSITSLSLRDNFDALSIDGRTVEPDDDSVYTPAPKGWDVIEA